MMNILGANDLVFWGTVSVSCKAAEVQPYNTLPVVGFAWFLRSIENVRGVSCAVICGIFLFGVRTLSRLWPMGHEYAVWRRQTWCSRSAAFGAWEYDEHINGTVSSLSLVCATRGSRKMNATTW